MPAAPSTIAIQYSLTGAKRQVFVATPGDTPTTLGRIPYKTKTTAPTLECVFNLISGLASVANTKLLRAKLPTSFRSARG